MNSQLRLKKFYKDDFNWFESEFLRMTRNNQLVQNKLFHQKKNTKTEQEFWYDNEYSKSEYYDIFIIYDEIKQTRIGYIKIKIDSIIHRRMIMGFVLSPEFLNMKYEVKLIKRAIAECKNIEFDVHKIYTELFTDDNNIEFYSKCGFEIDGIFREHVYTFKSYKDIYMMSKMVS